MTPERWQQVARVYQSAMEQEPSTRPAYLTSVCGDDAELRREVESLLAQPSAPGVIDRPLVDAAAHAFGSATNLAPGTMIGTYRIVELIGEGGMGQVYRATDANLARQVAIKVLPAAFVQDRERLARFEREAKTLAALNDPHIAQIYDLERSATTPALVMELVEGETLADRIARGPIPLDEALPIAKQIAEALETAHEQGIIHRDLKPANIKVRDDSTVKVLDFGLAKALEPATTTRSASLSPTITSPALMTGVGVLLGTAAYMSPEQARGKPADKRSDIWAFGCVLYEMLTGRSAFGDEDVSMTLSKVLQREPDYELLIPDIPARVQQTIRLCLRKPRNERMPDMGAVRLALEGAFETSPSESQQRVRPRLLRVTAVIAPAAALAAAVLGAAVWQFRSPPAQPIVTRFTYRLPEGQRFTNTGRQVVALSPDGTHVVYVADSRLYLKAMWESEATPITEPGGVVANPVFSPDGQWVAYWTGRTLRKVAISGGAPIKICDDVDLPFGLSWASGSLFFGGRQGVLRVSDGGGTPEVIIPVKGDELAHGPQLLPDGRSVLFTLATATASNQWDKALIVVQTPGSTERTTIIKGGADARYVGTGHLVYALGSGLFAEPFDIGRLQTLGGPVSVVDGVERAQGGTTGSAQFAVSQSGTLIYVPGPATVGQPGYDVALLDRNGTVDRIKLPSRVYQSPRFSPDGQQLALGIEGGPGANIWVYDLGGNQAIRQLTFEGNNRFPIWSRDGQRIVFQSDRAGDAAIFWQRADGNGPAERLTKAENGEAHIPDSWSRDGDTLLFNSRTEKGQFFLRTFTLHDRKTAPFDDVRSNGELNSMFSPDGRWVTYAEQGSSSNGTGSVYVRPFPVTDVKYRIGEGINPFWAPDGKALYFVPRAGNDSFSIVNITSEPRFAVSEPTSVKRPAITGGGALLPRAYDVAPNNQQFVLFVPSGNATTDLQINFVLNWVDELKARVPVH